MKVILLKGVPKVGKPEEVVEVSDGYAHNALFPKKLAIPATEQAIALLKQRQEGRIAQKAEQHALLDQAIKSVSGANITYRAPANEKGSLFSKIDAADISHFLLAEHRVSIDASHISIPDNAIKKTGTYEIAVHDGEYKSIIMLLVEKK